VKRRSPARCGNATSSTIVASPHGVAAFEPLVDVLLVDVVLVDVVLVDVVAAFAAMERR
jgi:hypothetical protein